MAGYWIVRTPAIKDQESYDEYASRWLPIAEKYGARYVVAREARHETREGPDFARVFVLEFPTYEQALACYDDADFQESLPHARKAYGDRDLVVVDSG